jgi:hypothetical protein
MPVAGLGRSGQAVTPAEHAATVRDASDVSVSPRATESLAALVALAERATEAEREVTRSESKRHEATLRQRQAEERATELERELDEKDDRHIAETAYSAKQQMRAEEAEARAKQLERELRDAQAFAANPTGGGTQATNALLRAAKARAEQLETALAEEREEHSATKETANGWREFLDIERAARERAETALRWIGDGGHYSDCRGNACDCASRRARGALGETAP